MQRDFSFPAPHAPPTPRRMELSPLLPILRGNISRAEGAVCFTDPSPTPEDGICSLLSLPERPEGSGLFPPLLGFAQRVLKEQLKAGFTHHFLGFLAQIPNLNHRPGEVTTATISLFSLTPKQKKKPKPK